VLRAERELRIINRLRSERVVRLAALSSSLGVSENTIRRDLRRLAETGILQRTHGGAFILDDEGGGRSAEDLEWLERQARFPDEKVRIGTAAAEMVRDGEAVIIDAGTTAMQVARALHGRHGVTVVTNAVNIGLELARSPSLTVVLTGGILRDISKSLVGPQAEEFLNADIHADRLFLSAGGVSVDAGVTNANTIEVPVKRAMIRAAREVVLVVTHDKIGRRSFTPIAPLPALSAIITDSGVDPAARAEIEARGVRVIVV